MRNLVHLHRRMVLEGPRGLAERLLFSFLVPLSWLYGWAGLIRCRLYRWGVFSSYRAPVPVISVGNLTVGGTGKTPVVDHVVRFFRRRGKRVAVVSRGYGGRGAGEVGIVCAGRGPLLPPEVCGDEPFLLARRNPEALVLVASKRAKGVRLASERLGAEVVVLDDGFQHLAVRRDLDLVLLDARRPYGNGHLLPAGMLRENLRALKRGDLFLMTRAEGEPGTTVLPGPVLHSRHVLGDRAVSLDGETRPLADLFGKKGVAFAGIADPQGFFDDLVTAGLRLVDQIAFPDHTPYGPKEVARIVEAAVGADYLVTSEKDGVKLNRMYFPIPCYQVPLRLVFSESRRLEEFLESVLRQEHHGRPQDSP